MIYELTVFLLDSLIKVKVLEIFFVLVFNWDMLKMSIVILHHTVAGIKIGKGIIRLIPL